MGLQAKARSDSADLFRQSSAEAVADFLKANGCHGQTDTDGQSPVEVYFQDLGWNFVSVGYLLPRDGKYVLRLGMAHRDEVSLDCPMSVMLFVEQFEKGTFKALIKKGRAA